MMEFRSRIINLLAAHFNATPDKFEDNTIASDIPGWDSLSHAELLLEIEDKFNIEFDLSDMMLMNNVGDLINLIISKK